MNDAELNAATPHDLLEKYVACLDNARYAAQNGWTLASRECRESAEAIAAEIERRCVR